MTSLSPDRWTQRSPPTQCHGVEAPPTQCHGVEAPPTQRENPFLYQPTHS